jgi:Amt family ammonium transporter
MGSYWFWTVFRLYRGFIGDPRPFFISRSRYEYRLEFSANYSIYAVLLYFKPICDNYTSTDGALLKGFVFVHLLFMVLFIIFVYAPLCHMTWHPEGVFFKMGFWILPGTVVHMSAGWAV